MFWVISAGTFARPVETRQRLMAPAGFRLGKTLLHDKTPPPGLVAHLLARDKRIERDGLVLGPQAARRPEIGDPAFGGNPGPRKWDNHRRIIDQVAQMGDRNGQIRGDHFCIVGSL